MQESLLRHRPAVLLLLAAIAGIVVSDAYAISDATLILVTLVCVSMAFVVRTRLPSLTLIVLFLGGTALYACLLTGSRTCEHSAFAKIAEYRPQNVVLRGSIESVEQFDNAQRWMLHVKDFSLSPNRNGNRQQIEIDARVLVWSRIEPSEIVRVRHTLSAMPRVGDRVQVFAALEPVRDASNPYEPSRMRMLQRRMQFDAVAEIHSVFDYSILTRQSGVMADISEAIDSARALFLARIDESIHDEDTRGFVEAVVLGERSRIDHDLYEDFTRAGISHILAVSGFNVGIVALVIGQLLRMIGLFNLRLRTFVVMIAAVAYGALVGFEPSVVRALVMIELYLLSIVLERRRDPVNILAFAAALNLVVRPNDLFDVGFQLTYSCVAGLVLVAPELKRLLLPAGWVTRPKWIREAVDMLVLSLGATLASMPVVVMQFHRVSIAGLLTNFPAIPLSSVITALGFLLVPLASISHWLGVLYGQASVLLTRILMAATSFMAALPSASRPVPEPTWPALALSVVGAIYLLRSESRKRLAARSSIVLLAGVATMALGVPLSHPVIATEGTLSLLVDDVGQGDCILLRTPHGKNYLIDCGPISKSGSVPIENTLLPMLRAESLMHLDGMFLSHMHRDHYGGALATFANCDVDHIYTSGERHRDPLAHALDSVVRRQRIPCSVLHRGDRIELDSAVTLYVLHPGTASTVHELTNYGLNANDGSLAFKVCFGNTSFLFLGDIERSDEELLKDEYGDFLQSTVVKVAHHGSLTSSSKEFGAMVKPRFAVISVGDNNRFGHPAQAVVRRWAGLGATVERTDKNGAVLFESDGATVHEIDWRSR